MEYKKIGFFKELQYGDKDGESLIDVISPYSINDQQDIINYLKNGIVIIACGGVVSDVINPSNEMIGCPDIMTDGVWIWPGDLSYYVKQYNVYLNNEFVLHVKKNNYQMPDESEIDMEKMELWLLEH